MHHPLLLVLTCIYQVYEYTVALQLMLPKDDFISCAENEGPVRIYYKCLVSIYVFPEMKLHTLVISKTEILYNFLSSSFHIHLSVSDLHISRIRLPILLQPNR